MNPPELAAFLKARVRTVRDWPKPKVNFRDVTTLLADPGASRAMGEVGRRHVVAHYGWQAVAKLMEDLYRTVLVSNSSKMGLS